MQYTPLVSVVMPAYKTRYIHEALESLLAQSYTNLELIVCDDSEGDALKQIVVEFTSKAAFPVRYSKNEKRLGEAASTDKSIDLATGTYIKFLHDDDVLYPNCIELLVRALEKNPKAVLATSKRERIDEQGLLLNEVFYTRSPFASDVLVGGLDLVSFLAEHTVNFLGEPSCVLCRRQNIFNLTDKFGWLNGNEIAWLGDLAFYAQLLGEGDLIYLIEPLTQVRISAEQTSQKARDQSGIGNKGYEDFRQAVRDLGWYRQTGDNNLLQVARLDANGKASSFRQFNLLNALQGEQNIVSQTEASVEQWLEQRKLSALQEQFLEQHQSNLAALKISVFILYDGIDQLAYKRTQKSLERHSSAKFVAQCIEINTSAEQWVELLNEQLASAQSWLMLVPAGAEFNASGLLKAQIDIAQAQGIRAISFDALYRQIKGKLAAVFRPAFVLDYLLSFPAGTAHCWLFNREAVTEAKGFNSQLPDALELDLILRLINQGGFDGLAHIAEPLVITEPPALANIDDERIAILQHLQQRGYEHAQIHAPLPGRYQMRYGHTDTPLVSIIIPTKNQLPMLQRCVESILEKTQYQNYEILIIDNNSDEQDAVQWLAGMESLAVERIRILRYPQPFNFSAINNFAAQHACGDYLLLLNNDTAVIGEDWLDQMLNHALRPEVGIVGAKLLFPDGRIQHAGVILGLKGPADHPFIGEAGDAPGYMQRLQVDQNYSAVTAACLLIRKNIYFDVDGMDEQAFKVSYNDVDLCLKVRELGYLIVWTPHAVLLHEGSVSQTKVDTAAQEAKRKRFVDEQDAMYDKWLPQLARDPAYNPNFSLVMPGGFKLADSQISWRPLDSIRPAPVALVHPADLFGCGHYRVMQPFLAMKEAGLVDGAISTGLMHVTDLERYNPDTIILQRQIGDERLEAMQRMQRFSKAFKVYELDDYLPNLPLKNAHRANMPKDILRSLRKGLSFVDRFVVSTEPLAEAFSGLHDEIVVMENRLPVSWWQGLQTQRRKGKKPRVGWAGGSSHTGDLELIADVVRDLADEVEWVFFGMCPEKLRPYVHEYHDGVAIEQYPAKLASLNLDLGLAPLEMNLFNECKSNLRLLEYGACGIPVVCTDIRCYQNDFPVMRVRNRYKDWVEAIRMHINDLDRAAKLGDDLQAKVRQEWMLEGANLELWRKAWLPS